MPNNIKSDFTCRNVSMFLLGSSLLSFLYCLYFSTNIEKHKQEILQTYRQGREIAENCPLKKALE
jgi:hypothetical protein